MSLTDAYNTLTNASNTHMYEYYEQYIPLVIIIICVFLVLDKMAFRIKMHKLHKIESSIDSKRRALAHERADLEYRYRIMR